jgi:hypothetical protein
VGYGSDSVHLCPVIVILIGNISTTLDSWGIVHF